jgi:hypothetical protein
MTDQELDRALVNALEVEPRADFLARVRMRLSAEPAPSAWRVQVHLAAAATIMVAAAVVIVVFWNGAEESPVGPPRRVAAPAEIAAAQPAPRVLAKGGEARALASRSAAAATVAVNPSPQPLISIDDARSVALLSASVRSGGIADLLPPAGVAEGPIELAALEVPLLGPEPSIQMDRIEAGERQ